MVRDGMALCTGAGMQLHSWQLRMHHNNLNDLERNLLQTSPHVCGGGPRDSHTGRSILVQKQVGTLGTVSHNV